MKSSSIHLFMGISVATMSWLLLIVLLGTMECMYLFELEFSPDICPAVRLLDHMVALFLVSLGKTPYCSP